MNANQIAFGIGLKRRLAGWPKCAPVRHTEAMLELNVVNQKARRPSRPAGLSQTRRTSFGMWRRWWKDTIRKTRRDR